MISDADIMGLARRAAQECRAWVRVDPDELLGAAAELLLEDSEADCAKVLYAMRKQIRREYSRRGWRHGHGRGGAQECAVVERPDVRAENNELTEILLWRMDARLMYVLALRASGMTCAETGRCLGVSRERASKLHMKAVLEARRLLRKEICDDN